MILMNQINVTLQQFTIFSAVVDNGSFTAAGQTLGLTQSAVSHAMANLEKELGAALLERKRDGVTLTVIGEQVLGRVRAILLQVERLRQDTASLLGLDVGNLRIGSVHSAASRILPSIIAAFRRRHPGVEVVLLEGTDDEVQQWVLSGAIDVGVAETQLSGRVSLAIAEDSLVAVLPSAHSLQSLKTVRVAQIADDPFIMCKGGSEALINSAFRAAGLAPRTQYEVRDMGTLLNMVEEGLGVAMVPELALPRALPNVCVARLMPTVRRQLGVIVGTAEHANPATRAFLHHAEDWLADQKNG